MRDRAIAIRWSNRLAAMPLTLLHWPFNGERIWRIPRFRGESRRIAPDERRSQKRPETRNRPAGCVRSDSGAFTGLLAARPAAKFATISRLPEMGVSAVVNRGP